MERSDRCVAETTEQTKIAETSGIGTSVLSRWSKGSHDPSTKYVVQFARAYGRSPIEALIIAGYIDPAEADTPVELVNVTIQDLDDADLVNELARRLDVRIQHFERALIQILVAVGQLQSYVEAMAAGEEDEDVSKISDHFGVLVYSIHALADRIVRDPSRLRRLSTEKAIEMRSRQIGHATSANIRNDLSSQITAWPFDYSNVRQLHSGIAYVRDDEILSRRRPSVSYWTTTDAGGLAEMIDPDPELVDEPPVEVRAARTESNKAGQAAIDRQDTDAERLSGEANAGGEE